jgi:hypothetical protein
LRTLPLCHIHRLYQSPSRIRSTRPFPHQHPFPSLHACFLPPTRKLSPLRSRLLGVLYWIACLLHIHCVRLHLHPGRPIQFGKSLGTGVEQLRKEDIMRHENPPPLRVTEHPPPHASQQHEDPHPHPNPHEDPPHTHTHTRSVPGEWASFLFVILEGDGMGTARWYELGAQNVQRRL